MVEFHTGDQDIRATRDTSYITGRKKNVIIAANGKNEFLLRRTRVLPMKNECIEECMVWAMRIMMTS